MENKKYEYSGHVLEFDRVIAYNWNAVTWAVSAKKARSNLCYQFKKQTKRSANSNIALPDRLKEAI